MAEVGEMAVELVFDGDSTVKGVSDVVVGYGVFFEEGETVVEGKLLSGIDERHTGEHECEGSHGVGGCAHAFELGAVP